MSQNQPTPAFSLARTAKKFFVSGFVILTFIVYALHERLVGPGGGIGAAAAQQPSSQAAPTMAQPEPTAPPQPTVAQRAPATPRPAPTVPQPSPAPAAPSAGLYRDGQYSGGEIDAFYGLVQVQAVIQQGKIADVQFLEYPNDRRTSIRINRVAIPALISEAIQAQSAEVDVVTGATLTSDAFMMSLQMALRDAQV
jgi:uncharacterized protein with FMN-binding domain